MREKIRLKDIAIHSKGQQINGKDLIEGGKYDYLNGGINPSGKWNEYNNEGNTVTISEGGNSSGYVNFMSEPFWCGAHCYYLYDVKGNSKYLYYALKSKQEQIMHLRTGATMPNIKKSVLGEFTFTYDYNLEEQEKVVQILEKTEKIIENRKVQISDLDNLIKSRFVEMFGNPVSNPRQWKVLSLDKACSKLTDGTHFSPENLEKGDYKYITAKNIKLSGFDFKGLTYVTEEVHKGIYSRCNPEHGDVLYIKDGATTGIAMVNSLDEEFSLLSSVALLKQDREIINGYYLCSALNSSEMYSNIRSIMGGAAITRLTITKLKQIKLPIPPIELQNQFADFIQQVDKLKIEVQKSLEETQLLFDSLMQKYFE